MQKRWLPISVACLAIVGGAIWFWWPRTPPPDPQVVRAKELQSKLAVDFGKAEKVPEQIKVIGELRDTMGQMTPEQRREVMMGPGGPRAMIRGQAQAFADLPLEERKPYLDKRIDEMEKFMAAMRQMGPPNGGGPGGPPRGERNFGGGGTRQERARGMLNNTTPEERALISEYFTALGERRKERGMPGFPGAR